MRGVALREARRLLRSSPDAEDAAHDALVRAWRARGSCRDAASRRAWMAQIARREALRRLARPAVAAQLDGHEPGDEDATLAGVAERVDVQRALGGLSEEDRMIVNLRYSEDMTQPRVAKRVGMPEGTVKVRLHRSRKLLRTALEEYAAGD